MTSTSTTASTADTECASCQTPGVFVCQVNQAGVVEATLLVVCGRCEDKGDPEPLCEQCIYPHEYWEHVCGHCSGWLGQ